MTYKEKLQQEHPEMINKKGECWNCPHDYGYCENPPIEYCRSMKNCNDCWEREIQSIDPSCDEVKAAYEQGLGDAWELAKKFFADMKDSELAEIFGANWSFPKIMECTPRETLAKLKAYEKSKNNIEVGDVVKVKSIAGSNYIGVVTQITSNQNCTCVVYSDGSVEVTTRNNITKTGKHIDIQSILSQIGGE